MITPIRTMTINQIEERKDDLLVSDADIMEIARNVRNKALDDFADKIIETYSYLPAFIVRELAERLKGGAE